MALKTLKDMDVTEKKVLVRAGFDPPFDDNGEITDDIRIEACVPTIQFLLDNNAKIILIGHNGRPKGEVVEKLKMDKVADKLSELLGKEVKKLDDCVGEDVEKAVKDMEAGDIILLENLRFHNEEKKHDKEFGKKLASLGEVFVMDAYTNAHHDDVSMVEIQKYLPSCIGLAVENEMSEVAKATENPEHPYIAIIGGAKPEKIDVVEALLPKADKIIISGVLANTFLKSAGVNIGDSKYDEETVEKAKQLLQDNIDKLILPIDTVVAEKFEADSKSDVKDIDNIGKGFIMGIGPKTIELYLSVLKDAKTVVWGGSIGVQEWEKFRKGTKAIAEFLAGSDAVTIVCGGDSGEAVHLVGVADKMAHVSIGGGATLTLLVGKELPAVKAVEESSK